METWFIYTLISVIFSGAFSFVQKISIERGYPSTLVNLISATFAAITALFITIAFYDFNGAAVYGIAAALASGLLYMFGSFFRLDSLRYIDSAIFFPLYKTFGPIFVLLIGIFLFLESFTAMEWIGIILGILVPLMLIHKSEKSRQKNLKKGLLLVTLTSLITALAAVFSRLGVDTFDSIFAFVSLNYVFSAVFAFFMYSINKYRAEKSGEPLKNSLKDWHVIKLSIISGVFQFAGFAFMMLGLKAGGPLAIVYTVNSFYILIPIILSIIVYKEHWNARKAFAIGLSLLALAFLR